VYSQNVLKQVVVEMNMTRKKISTGKRCPWKKVSMEKDVHGKDVLGKITLCKEYPQLKMSMSKNVPIKITLSKSIHN
jgi:hypothetical protein